MSKYIKTTSALTALTTGHGPLITFYAITAASIVIVGGR